MVESSYPCCGDGHVRRVLCKVSFIMGMGNGDDRILSCMMWQGRVFG